MANRVRYQPVSVGVVHDSELGFLLFFNEKWNGYAFCMKKPGPGDELAEVALTALSDDSPLEFPESSARPLEVIGAFGPSESGQEDTYYDYHVYEIDPGSQRSGVAADRNARFFSYQELISSDEVTWSTKSIARALLEHQEAGLAVVTRLVAGTRQYLLTYKPDYGYFFPSVRRKENEPAEALAIKAVRLDTGYEGELNATWRQETQDIHESNRFGGTRRQYVFQFCVVDVVGVDLAEPDNAFATALDELEQAKKASGQKSGTHGHAGWFSEEDLTGDPEISPTVSVVLPLLSAIVSS